MLPDVALFDANFRETLSKWLQFSDHVQKSIICEAPWKNFQTKFQNKGSYDVSNAFYWPQIKPRPP